MNKKEKAEQQQLQKSVDNIINKCVEEIWFLYDTDGNGYLDKDETRQFVRFILSVKDEKNQPDEESKDDGDKSTGEADEDDIDVFTKEEEEEFNALFTEFDVNNSETIEKEEMIEFIKKAALLR